MMSYTEETGEMQGGWDELHEVRRSCVLNCNRRLRPDTLAWEYGDLIWLSVLVITSRRCGSVP